MGVALQILALALSRIPKFTKFMWRSVRTNETCNGQWNGTEVVPHTQGNSTKYSSILIRSSSCFFYSYVHQSIYYSKSNKTSLGLFPLGSGNYFHQRSSGQYFACQWNIYETSGMSSWEASLIVAQSG